MVVAAVHLDLTDEASARLWRWLRARGLRDEVEVRPLCRAVPDPESCDDPPLSLELLMSVEQARLNGRAAVARVVDAAVDLLHDPAAPQPAGAASPADQLAAWLEVRRLAGLDLDGYDRAMRRLRHEVGGWHRYARATGVEDAPAVVLRDGTVVHLRLHHDLDPDEGEDLWRHLAALAGVEPARRRDD